MRLSILIGTLNRRAGLERMLSSVKAGTAVPHQMLVADAGSTDGTIDFLKEQDYAVPILQGQKLGYPKAYNAALEGVTTDYIALMADDTELVPGAMDLAVQILDGRPDLGAVALKMKDTQGVNANRPYMGAVSKYGVMTANHMCIRTSLFRRIGGFQEGYRWYYTDTDMSAAVLAAGYGTVLTKPVCILHHRDYEADGPERNKERWGVVEHDMNVYMNRWSWIPEPSQAEMQRLIQARGAAQLLWMGAKDENEPRLGWSLLDFTNWAYQRWIDHAAELRGSATPYYFEQRLPEAIRSIPLNPYALAKREEASISGSDLINSSIPSGTEMVVV